MNLSRRTFISIAGGAAAVAGLAACGSNTGGVDTGGEGGSNVELSQWYHEYGEEGVKEAVERYAADYKDAKVNVVWNPGDYAKKLNSQLLTDDVPDVFESEMGPTLDMIKAGQVVDLTDIMEPVKDTFNKGMMERLTFDGKIWGIPQTIDMQLLYYRKSLLEQAGLEPPKTFDELVNAAKALNTPTMGGFFAGNDGGIGVLGTMFIWASGNKQLTEDRSSLAFLTDSFYQALVSYRDFFNSGALLKAASKDWYDPDPFTNEECAMHWGGLWGLPAVTEALGDDFGVVPFPAMGATGQQAVPFGAFSCCVAAKGKNVDQAKAFAKWLWVDQEDKQVDFSDSYGTHIPAKPALASRATKLASGPGADAAKYVADLGQCNDIMWSGVVGTAYSDAVSNVILKNADPGAEFASVKKTAEAELERLKS